MCFLIFFHYISGAGMYEVKSGSLQAQATSDLQRVDWKIFYVYIRVMKKSKEFRLDLGYLDVFEPDAP